MENRSSEYWAFISYRHADNKTPGRQWATWLHQKIETYEVPSDLIGHINERGDTIPERIFPVFRDEDELPADADLATPIYRALERSKCLIVLCSPRSVQSQYVATEIAYFKKIGRSDRVLAVLLDGEPNASWHAGKQIDPEKTRECFPRPLMHPVGADGSLILEDRTEPIAADLRLDDGFEGWTTPEAYRQSLENEGLEPKKIADKVQSYQTKSDLAFLKVVAGVLGVPLGMLVQRDKNYQLQNARRKAQIFRRVALSLGALAVAAIGAGGFAYFQSKQAEAARENAEIQRNLAVQREREANEARAASEERRKETEEARIKEAAQRKIAVEKEREALRNLDISRKEQYLSGIRFANESLALDNRDTARDTLLSLPEREWSWEWDSLMELAGPPTLRFKRSQDPGELVSGDRKMAEQLTIAWNKITKESGTNDSIQKIHKSGALMAVATRYEGRSGSRLRVMRVEPKLIEPLLDLRTSNYDGINNISFTEDGSIMMVECQGFRGVNYKDLDARSDNTPSELDENDSYILIIPVPRRIMLGATNDLTVTPKEIPDLLESDWSSAREVNVGGKAWDISLVLSSYRTHNDMRDETRIEVSWDPNNTLPLIHDKPPESPEGSQLFMERLSHQRLPIKWHSAAIRNLSPSLDIQKVPSDSREIKGETFLLVNCLSGPHAAELWNLSKNTLVCTMGTPAQSEFDAENLMNFTDVGGGISVDGKLAIVSYISWPANLMPPSLEAVEFEYSAIGIFELPSGKMIDTFGSETTHVSGRGGVSPHFGFDWSGKIALYSSFEMAIPQNSVSTMNINDKNINRYDARFMSWSPDGAFAFRMEHESDSLTVCNSNGEPLGISLQKFHDSGYWPTFEVTPQGYDVDSGRFTVGRFLFQKGEAKPILDLGQVIVTSDLGKGAIIRSQRRVDLFTGALRKARLSNDPSGLNTAERLLYRMIKKEE